MHFVIVIYLLCVDFGRLRIEVSCMLINESHDISFEWRCTRGSNCQHNVMIIGGLFLLNVIFLLTLYIALCTFTHFFMCKDPLCLSIFCPILSLSRCIVYVPVVLVLTDYQWLCVDRSRTVFTPPPCISPKCLAFSKFLGGMPRSPHYRMFDFGLNRLRSCDLDLIVFHYVLELHPFVLSDK